MELRLTLIDADDGLVRGWRLLSPGRLGAPDALAQVDVDYPAWHQVARPVRRGCSP